LTVTPYPVSSQPVYQTGYPPAYRAPYPASSQPVFQTGYQPTYQAPSQPNEREVNSFGGTVHQSPDPQSPMLTVLPPGSRVSVIGSASGGSWAHVQVNGWDGYMDFAQLQ
jgi:hypothetical protein